MRASPLLQAVVSLCCGLSVGVAGDKTGIDQGSRKQTPIKEYQPLAYRVKAGFVPNKTTAVQGELLTLSFTLRGLDLWRGTQTSCDWNWMLTAGMLGAAAGAVTHFAMQACFAAGMPIVTGHHGEVALLETIRVGEYVLSCEEQDPLGPLVLKRVEAVFERWARILHIQVRDQVIRTRAEHPFWVRGKEAWVAAGALEVGDAFRSHDGQWVT